MCKLRVIRKNNGGEICSSIIDCENVSINPIDRPAYVLIVSKNGITELEFAFSSDKEPQEEFDFKNGKIKYGVNSGRIYSAIINTKSINETDVFHLSQQFDKLHTTERFSDNIKSFVSLINVAIYYAMNNPLLV